MGEMEHLERFENKSNLNNMRDREEMMKKS